MQNIELDLAGYAWLWIFVLSGAFLRMLFVFWRKNGNDWSKFRIEEAWNSVISSFLMIFASGIVNEILINLAWGTIDPSKAIFWFLFLCLGFIGVDGYHQINALLDAKKAARVP